MRYKRFTTRKDLGEISIKATNFSAYDFSHFWYIRIQSFWTKCSWTHLSFVQVERTGCVGHRVYTEYSANSIRPYCGYRIIIGREQLKESIRFKVFRNCGVSGVTMCYWSAHLFNIFLSGNFDHSFTDKIGRKGFSIFFSPNWIEMATLQIKKYLFDWLFYLYWKLLLKIVVKLFTV